MKNSQILILCAFILTLMSSTASAQNIQLNQFLELTGADKVVNESTRIILHESFVYLKSNSIEIDKPVKRTVKRKDSSIDYIINKNNYIRVYFDNFGYIISIFLYIENRVIYFNTTLLF